MSKVSIELVKQLRDLTAAAMGDCKSALEQTNGDIEAARDVLKIKGQTIAAARESKVAAEGMIAEAHLEDGSLRCLIEINSNTDFTSNSQEFKTFAAFTAQRLLQRTVANEVFTVNDVEDLRQTLAASTKENIVVRQWWVEQALNSSARVFSYVHSNNKIGVLLTMTSPSDNDPDFATIDPKFVELGNDIAMQIAAMSPLAISSDRLLPETIERQKAIFETQLKELNKPPTAWPKIMEGKFKKYYSEVCLLDQESVIHPKSTIRQVIENHNSHSEVVNFIRVVVGEGIETEHKDFAAEVAQLTGA